MTWQEELRKLDEDFSAGRLTADQYRERRDQVLSSAVAPGSQQPSQAGEPEPLPQGQGNSDGGSSEATQIVAPVSLPQTPPDYGAPPPGGYDAERTQAVQWQGQGPASPAQGFPQQGPPSPAHGFPQPQQDAWNAPAEDVNPPWAGGEFPPVSPSSEADWIKQGPESFDENGKSGSGKTVAIGLVALLVVVGGFAIWYFLMRDGEPESPVAGPGPSVSAAPTPIETGPPAAPKPDGAPFVDLTGDSRANIARPIDEAVATKSPTETEAKILKSAGATEVLGYGTTEGKAVLGLWQFKASSAKKAQDVLAEIDKLYSSAGYKAYGGEKYPKGVLAKFLAPTDKYDKNALTAYRAHYLLGDSVVRIETWSTDAGLAEKAFKDLMKRQLAEHPAG